jgi:hypothetical protein
LNDTALIGWRLVIKPVVGLMPHNLFRWCIMMMKLNDFSNICLRAAFFSLIKAPAMFLFFLFIFFSFNNSLSGLFLSEARQLTGNAPNDKVQVCYLKTSREKIDVKAPVYVQSKPCVSVLIDASVWQSSTDSTIRFFYWNIAFLGFLAWLMLNINFSLVKGKIKNSMSGKFKH